MFEALPTPAEMNRWDAEATALGLPALMLMENASREALHVLREEMTARNELLEGQRVLLFMGGGNNGGDAAALARHLLDAGAAPLVVHTRPLDSYAPTPAEHIRVAAACGVPFLSVERWKEHPSEAAMVPQIIVDGLLGTGFSGTLRPVERELVETINRLRDRCLVLALDIPSGLSGLSGLPCPEAIRAHATVTFEAAKPGLVLPWAESFTGTLHIRSIGIPARIRLAHPPTYNKLGNNWREALPPPSSVAHKGLAGHVLVAGGSAFYPGAATLAAAGAQRSGAGLVTLATPAPVMELVRAGNPHFMPRALPTENWNAHAAASLRPILAELAASRRAALVLGPGLGRGTDEAALVAAVLATARPRTVVDADALHGLDPQSLRASDILTPHPGEAAHLLGVETATVQADRFAAIDQLMALAPCVWVLKGECTLVGQRGRPVTLLPFRIPTLAVGGSGDVLAGCCGALLAQGLPPFAAACLAARLHCEAGLLLGQRFPGRGNTALDIADTIPRAFCF